MKNYRLRVLPVLLLIGTAAFSQQKSDTLITADFANATVTEFVHELEKQTGYYFYYDASRFDSVIIHISLQHEPLSRALDLAFANTGLRYAILPAGRKIFLTKGVDIRPTLGADFFRKNGSQEPSRAPANIPDYATAQKKAKADALIETKLFEVGAKTNVIGPGKASIAGYVRDARNGEPLGGVSIYVEDSPFNSYTDQYGYYSLTVPKGRMVLNIQGIGMRDTKRRVVLYGDGKLNIDMEERVTALKEVIVSAQKTANIKRVPMGVERLTIKAIKQLPTIFGEADVLRAVLTLPGVKTVGEASTGFNVRGGAADQNLILFNDATIYNPSHFFGFFSAFNPEVIQDLELYKSSIPAKYGGRLSSVLDISGREGNKKNYSGSAGIGMLTSRFNIEGPVIKNKMSFLGGVRTTYANWLLQYLPPAYNHSRAAFSDANLLLNYQLNNKNSLYATGYFSTDQFNLNNDTTYSYQNRNVSLKWKHSFNNKFNSVVTGGIDHYRYAISSQNNGLYGYKLSFNILQYSGKADFTWFFHPKHTIDFGLSSIRYVIHPGLYEPVGKRSLVVRDQMGTEQAEESAVYVSDRWNVNPDLSFQFGIRYSLFNYLGPKSVNEYPEGTPKDETNILSTRSYGNGDIIHTYHGPEYRISARYSFTPDFSVKASFNSLRQYIHVLSNTTAISPTDIWKLSDPNIKPQYGEQLSLGFYKNLQSNSIETSVEVYYKRIHDYLDYKSGATLVMNHHIETDVMNTEGKAYGIELMIKKQTGKLNGWLSYTYSRILLRMNDPSVGPIVNHGDFYPASYDKPHDVTLVSNYQFSHRFSISLTATYSTGRPITVPIGRFYYAGSQRTLYGDRNEARIPDYFRADFSMNIQGNHKVHQKTHNSWTLGLYNFLARKNPYSVYFVSENGVINGYKLSVFGTILPFINYNIKF